MNELEPIIIDFSEAIAKTKTTCDACGAALGGRYVDKHGSMSMNLLDDSGADGENAQFGKEHHVCNEDCARDLLNKRASKKGKK